MAGAYFVHRADLDGLTLSSYAEPSSIMCLVQSISWTKICNEYSRQLHRISVKLDWSDAAVFRDLGGRLLVVSELVPNLNG